MSLQTATSTTENLIPVGYSATGGVYDINIYVTVDGVQSAAFPVYVNTPYAQIKSDPNPIGCNYVDAPVGWQAAYYYYMSDLINDKLVALDTNESWENTKSLYSGESWSSITPTNWTPDDWISIGGVDYLPDTLGLCWDGGAGEVTPETTTWKTGTTTPIFSETQKFWVGSTSFNSGECPIRQAVTYYTNQVGFSNVTTPETVPSSCPIGQWAN